MKLLSSIAPLFAAALFTVLPHAALASDTATRAINAFATHCFLPSMTSMRADRLLGRTGARVDFYDLDPFFSRNAASDPNGRAVTQGTDRRCEVAFDGDHRDAAVAGALLGLEQQRIDQPATVPGFYNPTSGTALLAARRLSPIRVAVVHVGTRQGPNGTETFINVERLTRANSN